MKVLPYRLLVTSLAVGLGGLPLCAQAIRLNRPTGVRPMFSGGTISVVATPSQVSLDLIGGGAASASSGITITTTGSGLSLLSGASLYGYFTSTSALVDTHGDMIPSSDVLGLCLTGSPTTYSAFSQTSPFAGTASSLLIWHTANLLALTSGRTDVLQLKVDLTSAPQQPAGTYTGTLVLQIQAL